MFARCLHRRRQEREQRLAEARAATERSDRLSQVIGQLREEAIAVGAWAHDRYEANHLTDLFHRGRRP